MNLSKHFTLKEFISDGDSQEPSKLHIENLSRLATLVLEPLREKLGGPLIINSGWRSFEHNKRVGGAPGSQHLTGIAADIRVPGDLLDQIALGRILLTNKHVGGIGFYQAKQIIHVDIRLRSATGPIMWLQVSNGEYKPLPGNMLRLLKVGDKK